MLTVLSTAPSMTAWLGAVSSTSAAAGGGSAGPNWAGVFWIGCALWLLLRVWRGWQEGLPRQLFAILALLAGALAGWLLAPSVASLLRGYAAFPEPVLRTAGGILAGIVVWFLVNLVSRVLFKTTGQQTFAPIRLLYGAGGGLVGLVVGLVGIVIFASGVRLLGTVAEAVRTPATASSPNPQVKRTADGLHGLKQALENGPGGGLLELFDPVPAATYRQLSDTARVAADPRAQEHLLDDPKVRRLADHPKIAALREDREIARALEEKDFLRLLRDPRIIALVNDAQIQTQIRAIDWTAALKHALRMAPSPPAASDSR